MFTFEKIVQLDIDYTRIAIHQDKAMNRMGTQTDRHKLRLPKKMEKTVLSNPQGAAIEDRNGTLIAIRLPNVFEFVHVSSFMGYNYYFLNSPPGPDCSSRT